MTRSTAELSGASILARWPRGGAPAGLPLDLERRRPTAAPGGDSLEEGGLDGFTAEVAEGAEFRGRGGKVLKFWSSKVGIGEGMGKF